MKNGKPTSIRIIIKELDISSSKLINAHLIQYTARDRMNPQALLYHQDTMKLFEYLIDMKIGLIKDDDRLEQ